MIMRHTRRSSGGGENVLFLDLGGSFMVLEDSILKDKISPQIDLQIQCNPNRIFPLSVILEKLIRKYICKYKGT